MDDTRTNSRAPSHTVVTDNEVHDTIHGADIAHSTRLISEDSEVNLILVIPYSFGEIQRFHMLDDYQTHIYIHVLLR